MKVTDEIYLFRAVDGPTVFRDTLRVTGLETPPTYQTKSDELRSIPSFKILKARMMSARRRLRSRDKRLSCRSLSSYGRWQKPLTRRVARRWTLSSWFISALSVGHWVGSIAYSRCGCTMAQYSGEKAALGSSEDDVHTMKSNFLAAFAASMQCSDEVKVVSRGAPRFLA